MRLDGRRVLAVGASSGIGRALALELARRGARLVLSARRAGALEAVAAAVRAEGGEAEVLVADCADEASVEAAWREARAGGPVEALVFTAGVSRVSYPADLGAAEAEAVMQVNYLGFVRWLERFLPERLQAGEGLVAAASALCAYRGLPSGEAYAASKAALGNYLESLTIDLAPQGVEVVHLMPGFVESPMSDRNNFTQPFMIPAPWAASLAADALEAGRPRCEFGPGTSRLMRALRALPDGLYNRLMRPYADERLRVQRLLDELPPPVDPEDDRPLEFDRYGAWRDAKGAPRLGFLKDRFDVLECRPASAGGGQREQEVRAAYRLYSKVYPVAAYLAMVRVWGGALGPLVEHYRRTLDQAHGAGAPLLDVATGDGSLLALAARRARGMPALLSVDLSRDMVLKAARRLRGHPRRMFWIGDVLEAPLAPAAFSHVACYGGVHVFPRPAAVLAHLATRLAPGGTLAGSVLTLPDHEAGRRWAARFIEWGSLVSTPTEGELEAMFDAAGLEVDEREWNGTMWLFRARRR